MENKIETLAELKGEEVRLRNELDSKTIGEGLLPNETAMKYSRVHRKVKELESWLLWTIVSLILILSIGGCGTVAGIQSDIHQVTRPTTLERGQ